MSAPATPPASQGISARLRRIVVTLAEGGMIRRRNAGGAAATSYDTLVRRTFGTKRAELFARLSKAQMRTLAPILFNEAFEDVPSEATRGSVAASILGTPGVILMLAMIVAAGICINVELLQSGHLQDVGVTKPEFLPSLRRDAPDSSRKSPPNAAAPQQQPPRKDEPDQRK
jgi:hypothetical protein